MNNVHKCIFLITTDGIRGYRMTGDSGYEPVRYKGEPLYESNDFDRFLYDWFWEVEAVEKDDRIDFCILSEEPMESGIFSDPDLKQYMNGTSSWNKKAVLDFCKAEMSGSNCELIVDENRHFMVQNADIYNDSGLRQFYLKCIPDDMEEMEEEKKISVAEEGTPEPEETSVLCRFFIEALNERFAE